jgi:L-rhamnose mutarotase
MNIWMKRLATGSAAVFVLFVGRVWGVADEKAAMADRVFELRTYYCHDGKLEDLHKRFRDHTTTLFEKYGIENVGYWTPLEDEAAKNVLVYVMANPGRDAAKANWKAFMDDPDTTMLLKKHGIENASYSTPDDNPSKNTLIYIVAHPSREAAKANFAKFGKSDAWKKVVEESHRNGPLVKKMESVFMKPTDYSKIK